MRVIVAGSSAEYGASSDDPITEESSVSPVSDYGVSKLAATRMGQLLHGNAGQATIMVRPFNVIGPGHCANLLHADVARQVVEIEAGRRPPMLKLRGLGGFRDFVDVRDVATGMIALAECGSSGQIYNLCTEQVVQAHTLVEGLIAGSGVPIGIEAESKPPKFGDVPYQRGSFAKAKNAAGWAPRVALEKSLTDTLNYWRKARITASLLDHTPEALSK
jgi:GDP-4-dehydro-6-deoxy-D-mannose reductase